MTELKQHERVWRRAALLLDDLANAHGQNRGLRYADQATFCKIMADAYAVEHGPVSFTHSFKKIPL